MKKTNMENNIKQFRRLLVFSGIFNIVMATPLIFPFTYEKYFHFLWKINLFFGLGGIEPMAARQGISALLINTAGIDLVLIGVIVLYSSVDPVKRAFIPLANAIGRILFVFIAAYYCIVFDIARLTILIGAIDLAISIGFIYYLNKIGYFRE